MKQRQHRRGDAAGVRGLQPQREATFLRGTLVKGGEDWLGFMTSLHLDSAAASEETLRWKQHAAGN